TTTCLAPNEPAIQLRARPTQRVTSTSPDLGHDPMNGGCLGQPKSSFLAEQFRIHVRTWGCSHNNSDSEYMMGLLAQEGYVLTDQSDEADLCLFNSCTVKSPAEDHCRNAVERALSAGQKVVVAGCVPQGQRDGAFLQNVSLLGVQQLKRVGTVVEETLKGHRVTYLQGRSQYSEGYDLFMPKVRKNAQVEILAINSGCLNHCTYCKTKHARGQLRSFPPNLLVERARQTWTEGVTEIWLTSEDTGAYGRDLGTNIAALLRRLVRVIPSGCRLRLGMTNPPYILDQLPEIAEILRHPKVYSFLHLPIQAASDGVLRDMKRDYTQQDFRECVDFLRANVPHIHLATDIICGFPTETPEDFEETLDLCDFYRFPSLFINQFFPRPGTLAAKMQCVATKQEVKKRTKALHELFYSYSPLDDRLGQIHSVLITDVSHDKRFWVAHNLWYDQVLINKEQTNVEPGQLVWIRITNVTKFSVHGEPLTGRGVLAMLLLKKSSLNPLSIMAIVFTWLIVMLNFLLSLGVQLYLN
ncbi:hypothetical protein TCAL_10195, partial [Tigriopus californicus]